LQRRLCSEIGGLGWVSARRVKDSDNKILIFFKLKYFNRNLTEAFMNNSEDGEKRDAADRALIKNI
ncbi:MAG: hypothetical protein WBE11_10755, partial [Candidatus Aminicenantaceae bacterium]